MATPAQSEEYEGFGCPLCPADYGFSGDPLPAPVPGGPAPAHWYLALGGGPVEYDLEVAAFDDGSLQSASLDAEGSGARLVLGRMLGRALALEVGYVDLDRLQMTGVSTGTGSTSIPRWEAGAVDARLQTAGWTFAAAYHSPSLLRFRLSLRAGVFASCTEIRRQDAFGVMQTDTDAAGPLLGVGLSLRIWRGWSLAADWTRYQARFDDDETFEIDSATASLVVRF